MMGLVQTSFLMTAVDRDEPTVWAYLDIYSANLAGSEDGSKAQGGCGSGVAGQVESEVIAKVATGG